MRRKGFSHIFILIVAAIAITATVGSYFLAEKNKEPDPVLIPVLETLPTPLSNAQKKENSTITFLSPKILYRISPSQ